MTLSAWDLELSGFGDIKQNSPEVDASQRSPVSFGSLWGRLPKGFEKNYATPVDLD